MIHSLRTCSANTDRQTDTRTFTVPQLEYRSHAVECSVSEKRFLTAAVLLIVLMLPSSSAFLQRLRRKVTAGFTFDTTAPEGFTFQVNSSNRAGRRVPFPDESTGERCHCPAAYSSLPNIPRACFCLMRDCRMQCILLQSFCTRVNSTSIHSEVKLMRDIRLTLLVQISVVRLKAEMSSSRLFLGFFSQQHNVCDMEMIDDKISISLGL